MKARILNPEEWDRITSPELPALMPFIDPGNAAVVVVENGSGEIAASVAVLQVSHFEGLWIEPKYRGNAGVFRALIRLAYAVPRTRRERWIIGGARSGDPAMGLLCRRLGGQQLPLDFFVMPVGA